MWRQVASMRFVIQRYTRARKYANCDCHNHTSVFPQSILTPFFGAVLRKPSHTLTMSGAENRIVSCQTRKAIFAVEWNNMPRQCRTRRGRRPPPRLEKFRASSSCSKILEDKKYFNTAKFQGKCRLFRQKIYIFNTVNSGHTLFFRASTSCSKILNVKTIFNTVKYFRKNSVLRASASSSKIVISMQWKFSGQTLFFRASASCSKFWTMIQYSEFRTQCFSGQAKVAQTSWM